MEQNTRVFEGFYDASPQLQDGGLEFADPYEQEDYEDGYGGYGDDVGYNGYEEEYIDAEDDFIPENEDYAVYNEELDNNRRFHMAMNVFDAASVFAGVVVIFALTALIVTLLSWIRTDITHSFVILQSSIQ